MTQEADLKAMVVPLVTNSMLPQIAPEKFRDILWAFADKMLCKDSEDTIQAMLQDEINNLQSEIDTVNAALAGKASVSSVTTVINNLAALVTTVGTKLDTTTYTAGMATKADTTALTSGLSGKLDTTAATTLLNNKVDKTTKINGQALSGDITLVIPTITTGSAVTNAATNAPTNAPTDAKTDYGLIAAILGADVNATNTKQNATAANVNTVATNLNAVSAKLNSLMVTLRTNGIIAP